jgi:hypothetical protein
MKQADKMRKSTHFRDVYTHKNTHIDIYGNILIVETKVPAPLKSKPAF